MAVYKIPQDVEAEDKLLGPFTVKQSVFLFVAAFFGISGYFMAQVSPLFLILVAPPFLLFGFLGVYRREDQPIEVYLASRIRFLFKPHKRIWDSSGQTHSDLIVEKAKVEEGPRVGNLEREQVASSLDRLSVLMDSRGWSAKGASQIAPGFIQPGVQMSGRLATQGINTNMHATASDDILDPMSSQSSNTIMQLNRATQVENRRRALDAMNSQPNQDFTQEQQGQVQNARYQQATAQPQLATQPQSAVNQPTNPAIMNLLQNNDLTVDRIASQAQQAQKSDTTQ